MNKQLADSLWLNDSDCCGIEHLAELSGLSIEEINDLIDNGVIAPATTAAAPQSFQLSAVVLVQTARRLRDDFQLDSRGISLALTLLRRIRELEDEMNRHIAASVTARPGRRHN